MLLVLFILYFCRTFFPFFEISNHTESIQYCDKYYSKYKITLKFDRKSGDETGENKYHHILTINFEVYIKFRGTYGLLMRKKRACVCPEATHFANVYLKSWITFPFCSIENGLSVKTKKWKMYGVAFCKIDPFVSHSFFSHWPLHTKFIFSIRFKINQTLGQMNVILLVKSNVLLINLICIWQVSIYSINFLLLRILYECRYALNF